MIAPGTVKQLNEFLDELPEVPRDKVCVDDSNGYQAYAAMNFGRLGESTPTGVKMEVPDLGGVGGVFKYLGKVVSLAPEQRDEKGVPQGVLLLGGTFVVKSTEVTYAWADRIPGDYPKPAEVFAGLSED
ncbi:unnamed protein product [Effrenium voratum]|uniref:Uncharacterized protein n=1 Tax=Effrenium voratum TaxID=2562239 RepID=A0AA36JH75_9DINO|nr:unnamed protein product [Effrenium voratum]